MPHPDDHPRELQFPLYVKAPLVLLGLALAVFTVHIASEIIFPLFFAAIFAIMLHPVEQWLLRRRVPRLLAITLTVVLGVAALLGLCYFIYIEAAQLSSQMPMFKARLAQTTAQVHEWLQTRLGISDQKLGGWVSEAGNRASSLLGGTLSAVSGGAGGGHAHPGVHLFTVSVPAAAGRFSHPGVFWAPTFQQRGRGAAREQGHHPEQHGGAAG